MLGIKINIRSVQHSIRFANPNPNSNTSTKQGGFVEGKSVDWNPLLLSWTGWTEAI